MVFNSAHLKMIEEIDNVFGFATKKREDCNGNNMRRKLNFTGRWAYNWEGSYSVRRDNLSIFFFVYTMMGL